jgi:hypothetical protein
VLDVGISSYRLEPDVDDDGHRIYHTSCEVCEATISVGGVVVLLLDVRFCQICAIEVASDINNAIAKLR